MSHETSPPELPDPAVDCLSDLPELLIGEILSRLPTHEAARTSVLARRFRHLWRTSSTINLDRSAFRLARKFVTFSDRVFKLRNQDYRVSRLRINTGNYYYNKPLPLTKLKTWIKTAESLGMRELSLGIHLGVLLTIGPTLYTLKSLESLSIRFLDLPKIWETYNLPPSPIPLIHLKYLEIEYVFPPDFGRLINELPSLEHLHLKDVTESLNLSSRTVKTLQISCGWSLSRVMQLNFPVLEHLDLSIDVEFANVVRLQADFPAIKTAVVRLVHFQAKHVPAVGCILRNMRNISSLRLGILPLMVDSSPYNLLLEPEKEPPMLPNLRSFDLVTCIWKKTLEDLICLLEYMPVIEVMKLSRLDPIDKPRRKDRFRMYRQPFGSNEGHLHFTGLHLGNTKAELIRYFSGNRQVSKRQKKMKGSSPVFLNPSKSWVLS